MGEQNVPFDEVTIGNERVPVSRDNLLLYRHLGKNAIFDHIYITTPSGPGGYIWAHDELFERYAELAEEHQAQIHLNIPEPTEGDVNAYIRHTTKDLVADDTFPAEWLESPETDN